MPKAVNHAQNSRFSQNLGLPSQTGLLPLSRPPDQKGIRTIEASDAEQSSAFTRFPFSKDQALKTSKTTL